ncbi:MAG: DUF1854 domain-containing protein [Magnetococcales bacterium]|nr:DUF1854 domain-containing protein [Magnetococcales bacterium]NGZ26530.1 DUF1854 domain-containing protein [Magnetococcales bacterium]
MIEDPIMSNPTFDLHRDNWGRLILTMEDGSQHVGVEPVRAFPISDPDHGVAICGSDGAELLWVYDVPALPDAIRTLLEEALAHREFVPEIHRILEVSAPVSPSQWRVETDRGETTFTLRDESDIRRLGPKGLLINDANGIRYYIRDFSALDKFSRRTLDR